MGAIDWIARRAGYVLPSEAKPAKRAYNAAKSNLLTSSWDTQPTPTDYDIRLGLRTLRARSREISQNSDYVKRFLGLLRSNVVGPEGVVLRPRILNTRGGPDKLANEAVRDAWRRWGKFGVADVSGRMTWVGIQREVIANVARDGEVFIRPVIGQQNAFGFSLQFIDPELVDVDLNLEVADSRTGNRVVMGVELNGFDRPVAYYLMTPSRNAQSTGVYSYGRRSYTRVPADELHHLYLAEEGVSQTRGVPWTAASLYRLSMLNGYEEAELVAARVASAKMGFFEQEGGAEEYIGDDVDDDGNIITDAEPGSFEVLPKGMKVADWSPQHPTTSFADFVRANLRGIAAGLGVSYFTLANDLENVNYSSGRLGALEDREGWKALQNWLIGAFIEPVYTDWLRMALATSQIVVKGQPVTLARYAKLQRVTWQPRRWSWVDPQKDLTAQKTAVELRVKSISEVIREMGSDPEEVFTEIAEERERMNELGITPSEVMGALAAPGQEPPAED